MWIKLHSYFYPDEEVNVQVENICAVYKNHRKDMRDATLIQLAGSANYINVKESPEEVTEKITMVWSSRGKQELVR